MNDDLDIRELPADLVTPVGAYLRLREALGAPGFLLASTSVAFDHVRRTMTVTGPRAEVARVTAALEAAAPAPPAEPVAAGTAEAEMTRDGFVAAVLRAKEHIAAGDAFQIVPSQRVRRRTAASP